MTRRVILIGLAMFLGTTEPRARAAADPTAADLEHPLAQSKLSLVDGSTPARRRVVFKARFQRHGTMENPSFAGSTLRVRGSTPTAGDSGLVKLVASKWHALGTPPGSGGYRYEDPTGSAGGIRLLMLKQGRKRGVLQVAGGSASWPYAVSGPQGTVNVTVTVGKGRWCAEFRRLTARGTHRVSAKSNAAPASCPCEHFDSTFASIQSVIFDRHGCTTGPCHGASAQGSLDLRPDVAYHDLVDVASSVDPNQKRVEPGLASESMLWRKLAKATSGLAGVPGTGMPNGFPPIPDNELEAMRLWIHAGAPETGVVPDTEPLLGSCLPPADPIMIRAPAVPAPDVGVQLHAPPWTIPPHGENEVCYATYYNLASVIPDTAKAPCPDFWGGPTRTCFFYDKSELTQEPNSHHSIIHLYKGAYDSTRPGFHLFTCQGGQHDGVRCSIPSRPDCVFADGKPGGSCVETPYDIRDASSFGPFTCHGGANDGLACDPLGIGVPAPAGADCGPESGCAGRIFSGVACIFYGPPDFGFSVTGTGTNNAPSIGGSQQPVSSNVYPPAVFSMLPVDGIVVWNSHAFNVTDQPTSNQQWLNIYYAGVSDRTYPVQGIFDSTDIFIQDVPPFEKREYCRTYTLPKGARLFQLSSHTHKRGKLFRIWGPGITERCGTEDAIKPADCKAEAGPPIFTTTNYSDPMVLTFDPPVTLDGDENSRTYKFCSVYNNGADVPTEVKRQSTSPAPPLFLAPGGPCKDDVVACLAGPHKGELCHGDDRACDSAPGVQDGACDACPLRGGVTTEDEMFILLGLYYVVP